MRVNHLFSSRLQASLTVSSTRVLRSEVGNVPDLAVYNDPAVFGCVVIADLIHGNERFPSHRTAGLREIEV